jgi:DNA-binding CsgD family transcriptional regulator
MFGDVSMDAIKLNSSLPQGSPNQFEERLRFLLNTISYILNLDHCEIILSADGSQNYRTITCTPENESVFSQKHFIFNGYRNNNRPEERLVFFRELPLAENRNIDDDQKISTKAQREKFIASSELTIDDSLHVRFVLARDIDLGKFSDAEVGMIENCIDSIQNEIQIELGERYRASLFDSMEKLLARSRCGIMLFNRNFRVLRKSAILDDLLNEVRVYSCTEDRLCGSSPEHQSELEKTVHELYTSHHMDHRIVRTVENDRSNRFTIAIRKNIPDAPNVLLETSFSLFIFSWRDDISDLGPLFDLWNLSPAEKKVILAIAQFDNIKKVALALNLSSNTVKVQLKSSYRKLGIESKAMLFKRLNLVRKMDALLN